MNKQHIVIPCPSLTDAKVMTDLLSPMMSRRLVRLEREGTVLRLTHEVSMSPIEEALEYSDDFIRDTDEVDKIRNRSVNGCPKCGGPADNGYDRCMPPNAYHCSKCETLVSDECPPRKLVRLSDNKEMIKGLRQLQRDNQRVGKFTDVSTSIIANVAVFFIKLWRALRPPLKSLVNELRVFYTELCKFAWWLIKIALALTIPFVAASLFLEWAGGVNAWYVIQCIVWLIIAISAFEWARGGK